MKNLYVSLSINLLYSAGNCVIGFLSRSWWFITVGAYYAVLSSARFCVLSIAHQSEKNPDAERFARRTTGILLIVLSFCLVGINILSAIKERGSNFHVIAMIAIAAYSFTKMALAVTGMIKARRSTSEINKTLRNISLADSVVSIYSLQRSMLVSFPGMEPHTIQLFNILTGPAVWMIVLLLGINLTGGKYTEMAKAKIAAINEKIAETVTDGYKKVEQGVVGGYKKVERTVVEGYTKLEDRFVEAYLTHDNETVEEAKARLRKESK